MIENMRFPLERAYSMREYREIVDDRRIVQVWVYCFKLENGKSRSLMIPLRGLHKLAVNDKLRSEIYFDDGIRDSLKVVLLKGNDIEQKYALKLLCQLSFNAEIAKEIEADTELMMYINKPGGMFYSFIKQLFFNTRILMSNE